MVNTRPKVPVLIAFTRSQPYGKDVTISRDSEQRRGSWSHGYDLGLETELGQNVFLSAGAGT